MIRPTKWESNQVTFLAILRGFFLSMLYQRSYLHGDSKSGEAMSEDPLSFFFQLIILSRFHRDGS